MRQYATGSPELMKAMNKRLILNTIRQNGPVSRVDIAKETGLHPSTVTRIVTSLRAEGVVREEGRGQNHIGRKPIYLDLVPDALHFGGIALEANGISAVVANLQADIKMRAHWTLQGKSKEAIVDQMYRAVDWLLDEAQQRYVRLTSVGIAVHGIADSARGVMRFPPAFGWKDLPLADILAQRYSIPVRVGNNSTALTLGEHWFGRGRRVENMVAVKIGHGIGSGIMLNGTLLHGNDFSAGEIGHTTVAFDGPLCHCGNYGCLESVASVPAILNQARMRLKQGSASTLMGMIDGDLDALSLGHINQAALAGDAMTQQVLEEAAVYIGVAVANCINLLNPSLVLLGGDIYDTLPFLLPTIKAVAASRTLEIPRKRVTIEDVALRHDAVAIGAVVFVLQDIFRVPSAQNVSV